MPEPTGINSLAGRQGVEGFYILRSLPFLVNNYIPPKPFPDDASKSIFATLKEVRTRFPFNCNEEISAEWKNWAAKFSPKNNDAEQYVNDLKAKGVGYHSPLNMIICDPVQSLVRNWTLREPSRIDPTFEYPDNLKAAMNSVVNEFNLDPPLPRLSTLNNSQLLLDIQAYKDSRSVYTEFLKKCLNDDLRAMVRRNVLYDGIAISVNGKYILVIYFNRVAPNRMYF
jgi:hypothetical protein